MALNEANLEKRLNMVSTSQGSIQSMSFYCLHYKSHHKKIAQVWLRCLQKAKVPHRLTLIYLANDIVQNAKRKNTPSFIEDFKSILKETVPYLRDEKIKKSVERVFSIWQDRSIFDSKFTNELKNSLNDTGRGPPPPPTTQADPSPAVHNTSSKSDINQKSTANDLMSSLNRLASIEQNVERMKAGEDSIVDRLAHGNLINSDDSRTLNELKNYITNLKNEIDERNKLARLLEESMNNQRRLLKESEDQLLMYKSQLDFITKLRDDLCSSP